MANNTVHPGQVSAPLIEIDGVWKSFPGVVALRDVVMAGYPGEIHAVVGENGAGKSTLMRVIGGVYRADEGRVLIRGKEFASGGPKRAHELGVAIAYQETSLVPDLDVAHNIWLGAEPMGRLGLIDHEHLYGRSQELLAYVGLAVDAKMPVKLLSVAERQLVEVAKAVAQVPAILILDEPTAALAPQAVERLFEILQELKDGGLCILFVSHRIPEVLEIADRITVMKDGEVTGERPGKDIEESELVRLMVGRAPDVLYPERRTAIGSETVLEVKSLSDRSNFHDVSFTVRRGEIVGLAGIEGGGQRELVRCLFGLIPKRDGVISVNSKEVRIRSPRDAISAGLAYVTNDRHGEGLAVPLSVKENLSLPVLEKIARAGVLNGRQETALARQLVERLSIRTPSIAQPVELLSGGTQQKVSVGRWLKTEPSVLILDEPTVGVDVGAKLELYEMIRELSADGIAVIVVSVELRELLGICDRILVVADGYVVKEESASEASEQSLIEAAVRAAPNPSGDDRKGVARERRERVTQGPPVIQEPRRGEVRYGWTRALLDRWGSCLLLVTLLGGFVTYTVLQSEHFFDPVNISSLCLQWAPLGLVAFGQTLVLLVAGVDLSVGPLMSLVTAELSFLMTSESGGSIVLAIVVALGTGVGVGLLNGLLIRFLRIPDLIVTLATYLGILGLALVLRPAPGGSVAFSFMTAMTYQIGPIPLAAILVFVLFVLGEIVLLRTRVGTYVYAAGSRPYATFESGVPVARVRLTAYVIAGLLASIGGLLLAARIGSGDPQIGTTYTLDSVTAAVVGGASLFGGRGTLTGGLLGALLIVGMQNFLNLLGTSSYYQYVWTGGLTLFAVGLYSVNARAVIERVARWRESVRAAALAVPGRA